MQSFVIFVGCAVKFDAGDEVGHRGGGWC
jgi:hypothetical protein